MHMLVLHFMAYYDTGYFHFKLNQIITQPEHIVDRVMVPLNRVFPSATRFALWEALIPSIVMPLVGASNEGWLWACGTLAR